jgi:hypothetical protein
VYSLLSGPVFSFLFIYCCFPKQLHHLTFPPAVHEDCSFSTFLLYYLCFVLPIFIVVFIYMFIKTNGVGYFFMSSCPLLGEVSVNIFAHFSIELFYQRIFKTFLCIVVVLFLFLKWAFLCWLPFS